VILIGDYNVGKTTLFQRLLGLDIKTPQIQTMRSLGPEKDADIELKLFAY
jgi:GTPase SAR1 family protein